MENPVEMSIGTGVALQSSSNLYLSAMHQLGIARWKIPTDFNLSASEMVVLYILGAEWVRGVIIYSVWNGKTVYFDSFRDVRKT